MDVNGTEIAALIGAAAAACAVSVKLVDRLVDLVVSRFSSAPKDSAEERNDLLRQILGATVQQTRHLELHAREVIAQRELLYQILDAVKPPSTWRGPRIVSPKGDPA